MTNNQENTNNLANENTSSTNNGTTEQVHYSIGRIVFVIIFLFLPFGGWLTKYLTFHTTKKTTAKKLTQQLNSM